MLDIDKKWHLAENEKESELSDFELQLWRVFNGFLTWQEQCEQSANADDLKAYDLAVLHIIKMQDRPKTIPELCRLLNRED
jgi:predicted MarR family transcription regulator